jgi:hypothetical protein
MPPKATNVNVQASTEGRLSSGAMVDEQGRYELKGLPPGTWKVMAYGRVGDKSWRAEGQAAVGGTLDLTLEERVR